MKWLWQMANKHHISVSGAAFSLVLRSFDGYLKELEFNHPLRAHESTDQTFDSPWSSEVCPCSTESSRCILQRHSIKPRRWTAKPQSATGIFLEEKDVSSEAVIHPSPHLACFWSSTVKNITHWRKIVLYFMSTLRCHRGTVPSVICSQHCLLIKQEGQLADGLFEANGSSLSCN